MDQFELASQTTGAAAIARGVIIAVSFYKNEALVESLLEGLLACAADIRAIGGEVLLYCDSPDHAPLRAALAAALPRAEAAFPCRLTVNAENLGFVRTMNLAVAEAVASGRDLILLNSDTVVEPGAFPEMTRVLRLDHMHGFVNPRSDNATIATLRPRFVPEDKGAARAVYRALADLLPETAYIPTAVGFCLLIAWRVLAELGGLDEIYGKGYNEENDLVMRAARCGFRAVLANRAFVWHEGETSFAASDTDRSVWERTNRAILDERYPEYGPYTAAFYDSPAALAEQLMAALLPDAEGKRDIALDFSSFRPAHNGTYQAGRQLLAAASAQWTQTYRLHVICSETVYAYHGYAEFGVPRVDPHTPQRFAAIFRVGQPYDWNVLQRLTMTGAVIGLYMLDTISVDCPPLFSNLLHAIWQFGLDHADVIATQSRQTARHFALRFRLPAEAVHVIAPHSMALADYRLQGADEAEAASGAGRPILVLGNHFHHKFLVPTANALARALPLRDIVALGMPKPLRPGARQFLPPLPDLAQLPNLRGLPAGDLSEAEMGALYAGCDAVVFPSHAEGFGFPVFNALAARRPLFVRRLPVFEELWESLGRPRNMHFYETTAALIEMLAAQPRWVPEQCTSPYGAAENARDILAALEQAMAGASYSRVMRRIETVQLASAFARDPEALAPENDADRAAHFLAERVQGVARRVLSRPLAYRATQALWRMAKTVRRR